MLENYLKDPSKINKLFNKFKSPEFGLLFRDLLGKDIKKKLDLKEHPDKGVYVHEISLHSVHNTQVNS